MQSHQLKLHLYSTSKDLYTRGGGALLWSFIEGSYGYDITWRQRLDKYRKLETFVDHIAKSKLFIKRVVDSRKVSKAEVFV